LENFEPNLVFDQFGEAPISEVGADNIVWAKFPALTNSPSQSEVIDGVTPNDSSFTAETISVQSKQYGMYVILTDKVKKKNLFNLSMIVAEILGDNMARISDLVIQNEVTDNATTRILAATTAGGTRAAARVNISATHIMFTYDIACVATVLSGKSAPKFGNAYA
jgi:N4-gp56 family major capsid protein